MTTWPVIRDPDRLRCGYSYNHIILENVIYKYSTLRDRQYYTVNNFYIHIFVYWTSYKSLRLTD